MFFIGIFPIKTFTAVGLTVDTLFIVRSLPPFALLHDEIRLQRRFEYIPLIFRALKEYA